MVEETSMKCRMCRGDSFKEVINFGEAPLVNSLIEKKDLDKKEETFPLVVHQCQTCHLVQIVNPIDSKKIYQDVDYLYFSSDMPGLFEYFRTYADEMHNKYLKAGDFVVEIGSNDGIWLKNYTKWARILGVEPATNVALRALKLGIPTINQFFSERLAKQIAKEYGKAKVIMGANCIAHLADLHDLLRGVKALLTDDGVFSVECNYWGGMVDNVNYALIYHDHFSYFTVNVWEKFLKEYGYHVFDGEVTPAQGGSLRIYIGGSSHAKTKRVIELFKKEAETKLNSYETCLKYKTACMAKAATLRHLIIDLKASGKKLAGYGAAAKGFSLLQLAGITTELDFFVDDSPAKQGKYTPVHHIPVVARDSVEYPDYFFITAPNYAGVIMKKERRRGFKGGFILEDGSIK